MSKPVEPLRGDAAWRAAKKGVAERNEEAFARGRRERAARDSARVVRRASAEVLEAAADRDPATRKVRDAFLAFQAQVSPWSAMAAMGANARR